MGIENIAGGGLGIFGFVNIIKFFSYALAIGIILISIANSFAYGINNHDWKPFADETAGRIFASDNLIYKDVMTIKNSTEIGNKLEVGYFDYLKNDIFKNLMVWLFMLYGVWRLLIGAFGGWGFVNNIKKVGILLLAILIVFTVEMSYMIIYNLITTSGSIDIGFKGLYYLVKEYRLIFLK